MTYSSEYERLLFKILTKTNKGRCVEKKKKLKILQNNDVSDGFDSELIDFKSFFWL